MGEPINAFRTKTNADIGHGDSLIGHKTQLSLSILKMELHRVLASSCKLSSPPDPALHFL